MRTIRGVITPLLTPLTHEGSIDLEGLRRLIEQQVDAGIHGIFLAGTTGEGMALTAAQRGELVRGACGAIGGRIPVVVDVGANCLADALLYAAQAERAGAQAVALQPPAYFPLEAHDLLDYYENFLRSTPLELFLYHIPAFTAGLPMDVVQQLAPHPRVLGIKDSGASEEYFEQLLSTCRHDDFAILLGDQSRMGEGLRRGADGIVPSLGNVEPALCVQMMEAAWASDWGRLEHLNQSLQQHTRAMRSRSFSAMIRAMKRQLADEGVLASDRLTSIFSNEAPLAAAQGAV